jgi:hypothetical protein
VRAPDDDAGGRDHEAPEFDAGALARSHGPAAIAELLRLGIEATSEPVRLAALRELLERGFGRISAAAGSEKGETLCYLMLDDGYDEEDRDWT